MEGTLPLTCSNDVLREARRRADVAGREDLAWVDFKGILMVHQAQRQATQEEMESVASAANGNMRLRLHHMSTSCSIGFCTVGCESSSSLDDTCATAIPLHRAEGDNTTAEERSRRMLKLLRLT